MKKKSKPVNVSTFIGNGCIMEGDIQFSGSIHVDGFFRGKIISDNGMIIIGEHAKVEAEIDVENVTVNGQVTGTIVAREQIRVSTSGSVFGDMYSPVISIDPGASFNGNCGTKPPEAPEQTPDEETGKKDESQSKKKGSQKTEVKKEEE